MHFGIHDLIYKTFKKDECDEIYEKLEPGLYIDPYDVYDYHERGCMNCMNLINIDFKLKNNKIYIRFIIQHDIISTILIRK